MSSNYRTVYSTDPKDRVHCPTCNKLMDECRCVANEGVDVNRFTAIFRIEKGGRGGKTVTVLDGLPKNEDFLKQLTKELKVRCGSGGTYKMDQRAGQIEIQGDKRVQIKSFLDSRKIRYKGV